VLTIASLKHQHEPAEEIQGLILIDCWEAVAGRATGKFYQNLLQHLEKFNITNVVSAAYTTTVGESADMSNYLYNNLKKHSEVVSILDPGQLVDYCQKVNIYKWFVAGKSWQQCVHSRPMGLINFAQMKGITFYSDDYAFIRDDDFTTSQQDFKEDSLFWQTVDNTGYRLVQDN
jgi:hypothetical protein